MKGGGCYGGGEKKERILLGWRRIIERERWKRKKEGMVKERGWCGMIR